MSSAFCRNRSRDPGFADGAPACVDRPAGDRSETGRLVQARTESSRWPQPCPPLGMFKLMLLGQWHRLSDVQLEEALKVHLDFLVYGGFDLGVPTACRYHKTHSWGYQKGGTQKRYQNRF